MECGDLVRVEIGGDERLRYKRTGYLSHMGARNTELIEALPVGPEIIADCRHDQRIITKQFQVVGNIAGRAAKLATHVRNHKCDIQDVNLVGQDMGFELTMKNHNGVVSKGTAN